MNKEKKIKLIILIALIVILGLLGFRECANKEKVEDAINNVEIEKNRVNEITLSMVPVKTLNPLVSTDEDIFYISKLIYSSLYTFDKNMTPVGDLAKNYEFNGDTVNISLKNAKWHDGKNVDADDVEFTVDAIKAIGEKGEYYEKADKIESVSGSGTNVKIEFKDENDMSLSYLSFPILPEHKFDGTYALKKDVDDFKPVGSGRFEFSSYDASKAMILKKNKDYYGEEAVSDLKIKVVKTSSNRTKMTETSNISVFLDKDMNRDSKITKKDIKIKNFVGNQVEFIGFNFQNPALANKEIRHALAYAIDIDKIIEEDYYNSAVKSDSLYFQNYLGTEKIKEEYKFNIDKAVEILKDEEFKDTNDDGILEGKDGQKLKFKMIVNSSEPQRVEAAENIIDVLKELNIEVELSTLDEAAYLKALKTGSFDLFIGGMSLDESLNMRDLLITDGQLNFIKYSNEEVDKHVNNLMSGDTAEENTATINELKKILNEELPYYCIGYKTFGIVKAPVFNGNINANFSNPYNGIENWYCEYEKRIVEDKKLEQPKEGK